MSLGSPCDGVPPKGTIKVNIESTVLRRVLKIKKLS